MMCNYLDPILFRKAQIARANAARAAQTEEQFLSVAESTTYDYIPMCECPTCLEMADFIKESETF